MSIDENKIVVTPSPERLISSLMNVGHDFTTAISDLVDNSIEAGATKISVHVRFDGEKSAVRISDNGKGMNLETMKEAMRFGTRRDYRPSDLGKFGLGLKTASLSQCRKFTIASRPSQSNADVYAMSWDMDHLEKSKEWEVIQIQEDDLDRNILKPLLESMGTVVYWTQIKNLFEYRNPGSGWAKNRLVKMCTELENHLAMVFHRFLNGSDECRAVKIMLNGNDINAWDPFSRNEEHTKIYPPTTIKFEEEYSKGEVKIAPFVLPPQKLFSSPKAFKAASGPASWNQQQGFYIYRAGRMIQSGGWCDIRTADEHTKLARVALHFSPDLDKVFNIDIAKMNVSLPASLKEQIKNHIAPIIKSAQDRYRRPKSADDEASGGSSQGTRPGTSRPPTRTPHKWTFQEIVTLFKLAALPEELPVLEKIIQRVQANTGKK